MKVRIGEDLYPHWVLRDETEWKLYESFPEFLKAVWDHLNLPTPTRAQLEIAHRLQYGYDSTEARTLSKKELRRRLKEARQDIIRAFRSLGKSYITACFAIWLLMRNPRDEKVLVVSATGAKAKQFVRQVKGIIQSFGPCQWLLEGDRENGIERRDQAELFDVAGSSLSQVASMTAAGITGQITGNRATTIIADDIEIPDNSKTEEARQRIINVVSSDFGPIATTEHGRGDIIFLGTPQTAESVYNHLVVAMQFSCFCIPARFPTKADNYLLTTEGGTVVNILAPYLVDLHENGGLRSGKPTDSRFTEEDLITFEGRGRSTFMLQYMLDCTLSDAERYPLKQFDLIVFEVNAFKAPLTVQWGRDSDGKNVIRDIPNVGFAGDRLMRPLFVDKEWRDYEVSLLFVDPAGRGKDETAWVVLKSLAGMIYLVHIDGEVTDNASAMRKIANDAKRFNVNTVAVEPNAGLGMWVEAFKPILAKVWKDGGCHVEESEWAKGQKEARIIDTLEPVLNTHKLTVCESLLVQDVKRDPKYSLLRQLTHITRDRGSLTHEDRLDALAGGVAHLKKAAGVDEDVAAKAIREAEMEEELQKFMSAVAQNYPISPGARVGRYLGDGCYEEVYSTNPW